MQVSSESYCCSIPWSQQKGGREIQIGRKKVSFFFCFSATDYVTRQTLAAYSYFT